MKVIILLALILFSTPVHAFDVETCSLIGDMAEKVMVKRQSGVSMSIMMKADPDNKILQAIIVDAYEKPRYNMKKIRKIVIEDFRDQVFLICIKGE